MTWGWVRWLVKFFLVLTSWKDFRRGKFQVWKKNFDFFCVSFVTEIGRSNPWQNPYIISNTFFSMKKWKISKSVCDGIISRPVGMGFLFTKRFGWFPDIIVCKIFILKKFQIKLLWCTVTEKVGLHRVCQIRVQKSEILNIWWWNTFDKIFFLKTI